MEKLLIKSNNDHDLLLLLFFFFQGDSPAEPQVQAPMLDMTPQFW